jgi:hypothetical protein
MGKETLAWFEAAIAAVERIGIAKTLLIFIALGSLFQIKQIFNGFNKDTRYYFDAPPEIDTYQCKGRK